MQGFAALAARRTRRGITLIEACCVLAIASVLVGTAVPSVKGVFGKVRMDGVVSELASDVALARGLAVTKNKGVRLTIAASADGAACAIVHSGPAASCECALGGSAVCGADVEVFKASSFPAGGPISVSANVPSLRFDPTNGTTAPAATITVSDAQGRQVRHVVSMMGRVRTCSSVARSGYAAC
jgi:type IV fimbrial biogenesis protein FimT